MDGRNGEVHLGREKVGEMPLSCSLAKVVATSSALGANVSHLSTLVALLLKVLLVTLFKLLSKLVFDMVGRALEELLDLEVVALF